MAKTPVYRFFLYFPTYQYGIFLYYTRQSIDTGHLFLHASIPLKLAEKKRGESVPRIVCPCNKFYALQSALVNSTLLGPLNFVELSRK